MIVITESGTAYQFEDGKVRRLSAGNDMRRDGDWLDYTAIIEPVVGRRMVLALEPLGEGDATIRSTSPVTEIRQ